MPVSFPSTSIAAVAATAAAATTTTTTTTTSATPPFSSPFSRQPATYCAPPRLSRTVPEQEINSLISLHLSCRIHVKCSYYSILLYLRITGAPCNLRLRSVQDKDVGIESR